MAPNDGQIHCGTCTARLDSACGSLYIYDVKALEVLVAKLPCIWASCSEPAPILLEGFSVESWAHSAKKKANIATSVCKVNGLLKTEIAGRN